MTQLCYSEIQASSEQRTEVYIWSLHGASCTENTADIVEMGLN